jgi:hypothetical protein
MTRKLFLFLSLLLTPAVLSAQDVSPAVWAKPDHFWFRKTFPGGANVWLTVDALHGAKEPLFDHQRLATELRVRTGVEFDQNQLPFADPGAQFVVKYDGSNSYIQQGAMAVEFVMNGSHWRCELQIKWDWNKLPPTDYECTPRRPFVPGVSPVALPADPGVRISPDGKWRALIQNHNVVVQPLGATVPLPAVALSTDGTPGFAYHVASIQWSADSKSLSAYRVSEQIFQPNSVTANVKSLVAKKQWTIPE